MTPEEEQSARAAIEAEHEASDWVVSELNRIASSEQIAEWRLNGWGDGYCGALMEWWRSALENAGYATAGDRDPSRKPPRKSLSRSLVRAVMERDAYRCVTCGTHLNLSVDHIEPVSKGGSDDLDNLQTMCQPCNSRKGDR